jgi:hypothetical protein
LAGSDKVAENTPLRQLALEGEPGTAGVVESVHDAALEMLAESSTGPPVLATVGKDGVRWVMEGPDVVADAGRTSNRHGERTAMVKVNAFHQGFRAVGLLVTGPRYRRLQRRGVVVGDESVRPGGEITSTT